MPNASSPEQQAWELTCSPMITSDVIWKLDAYRAAMFLIHVARQDCARLRIDHELASQLRRAVGSVGAILSEGYSRSTRRDRLRFLGYALASVRECVAWYEDSRDLLAEKIVDDRLVLVARIRALLLGMIRSLRRETDGRTDLERG